MQLNEQEQRDVAKGIQQINAGIAAAMKAGGHDNETALHTVAVDVFFPSDSRTGGLTDATLDAIRYPFRGRGWMHIAANPVGTLHWTFTLNRTIPSLTISSGPA